MTTRRRVLLLGATGTIGRATARALVARGHDVVCVVRPRADVDRLRELDGATVRVGDVGDGRSFADDGVRGERFDALVSCLASRTGEPADAWAIDHRAHVMALDAARAAGVERVVHLSAICVQKPRLAFQHAKLAYERVAGRVRRRPRDRATDRVLQIAVGPGRARATRQAVPRLR